jgi:hypothetical protein
MVTAQTRKQSRLEMNVQPENKTIAYVTFTHLVAQAIAHPI